MARIVSRKIKKVGAEISLIPVMSLFLILVPMLLLTAEFERAAVIDLFLPSSDIKPQQNSANDPSLDLTIAVSLDKLVMVANKKRITISARIVGKERVFDLNKLGVELLKVKKQYPKAEEVVILLEGDVRYDTIIQVMDAAREMSLADGNLIKLFPNVALADRIVAADSGKEVAD